jgi:pimeloyl-ACP methyl ester carboxylesterase
MPQLERHGLSFHAQLLGAGPPLAMLHGLFVGSLAAWYFGAGARLAARYRVLMYDARGHGLTTRAPSGYDLKTLSEDLGALLGEAGEGPGAPAVLVGHSYGALTALTFALAHPERVARLLLVDLPTPPSRLDELAAFLGAPPERMVDSLPTALRDTVVRGGRQGARFLAQLKFLATESTLLADIRNESPLDDAALARIRCPVSMVYGESSSCRADGERVAARIPGARLSYMPGGHFLPSEAPGPLAEWIDAELAVPAAEAARG